MTTFAIAMLTAPRPHGATIGAALESLRDAGFHESVHVFDDGAGLALADPYTLIYPRAQRLGSSTNFYSALRTIVGNEADWFVVLEDDTTWSTPPGRGRYVLEELLADVPLIKFGALSLHCMRAVSDHLEQLHGGGRRLAPGLYESRLGARTWGSQALVFSRSSAISLIGSLVMQQSIYDRQRIDQAVGGALKALDLALYYWLPCLVRHELGARNSSLYSAEPAVLDAPGRTCVYLP